MHQRCCYVDAVKPPAAEHREDRGSLVLAESTEACRLESWHWHRVAVEDVGLSDHFLLRWKVNTSTVVRGANWTWSRSDRRYPHRGCASQPTGLLTLMS